MTATLTNGTARHAAATTWLESLAAGVELTGAQLADRFDMGERWGRLVIAEARTQLYSNPSATPAAERHDDPATTDSPFVRHITTVSVVIVAIVAAVASYDHQRLLADLAGEGWRSVLLPFSVDGLVVAASMIMYDRRRHDRSAGLLPWSALLLGLGASLAANVAAAEPTLIGRAVAAWPPVALAISYELLMRQVAEGEG